MRNLVEGYIFVQKNVVLTLLGRHAGAARAEM
jgi:hypothetical protein